MASQIAEVDAGELAGTILNWLDRDENAKVAWLKRPAGRFGKAIIYLTERRASLV